MARVQFNVSLDPSLAEAVRRQAHVERRPVSQWVSEVLSANLGLDGDERLDEIEQRLSRLEELARGGDSY